MDADWSTVALEATLSAKLETTVTDVELLADGLNLVLELTTERGDRYVLRRPRKLRQTSYINALDREYRVMELLVETSVPTPEPVLFCEDDSVLGGPSFLMTALRGEVVPLGSELPREFQTEHARKRVGELLVDTLAEIHAVETEPFTEVCEHHSPRGQIERSLDRLEAVAATTALDLSSLRTVAHWLLENAPPEYEPALLHGDFRPGNVLFATPTAPEVTGVLDWETALLGDPLTELGYLLLRWRDDGDPSLELDGLEARYGTDAVADLRRRDERGLAPFTARPGSPSRRALIARYERRTGRSFEHDRFYRAHAAVLLATAWADLHRHQRETGTESTWPPYVEYVSMLAAAIVSGEQPL